MTYFGAAQARAERDLRSAVSACAGTPKNIAIYGAGPLVASADVRLVFWLAKSEVSILAEIVDCGWRAAGRACYTANPINHAKVAQLKALADVLQARLSEVTH